MMLRRIFPTLLLMDGIADNATVELDTVLIWAQTMGRLGKLARRHRMPYVRHSARPGSE